MKRAHGFTLLEVIIAIAVFAIFSAMAYGGLMRLLENRDRVDAERAFWREISLCFVRIRQDVSLVRNRPIRDTNNEELKPFLGHAPDPRALAAPDMEFTRGGLLVLSDTTGDLQRVGYRLQEGRLMRLTWPVVDRAPLTKADATPVLQNVEEFAVRFLDEGSTYSDWPPPPQTTTGNNTPSDFPDGVEVTVVIKDHGKFTRTFVVGAQN
ncbi:MAG: type II secretion system minor pseudopilin GspJ [Gammaproteobacteria bacterium]|nr:type II secretion system minor pseudopilin GspJ [Gammaproteobacteria bacterium]